MIRSPVLILILLTGLNLLNYLDRFVLSAVLKKMKSPEELDLSNFVSGSLATVFLIGYFATSPIFGTLGDRGGRKVLIALGILVWSLATIGTGFAGGTVTLIIARALVGVGEASYATIAPTIIDDLAPPAKRGRWLAYFYAAAPIGSALGFVIGGVVGQRVGWREAFFVAGGPGILLAALCLLIKEPVKHEAPPKVSLLKSTATLMRVPLYVKGVLGYCAYTFAIGGFAFWGPTFLGERYKLDLEDAGFKFGVVTVVAGAVGTMLGGWLGDRAARRAQKKQAEMSGPASTEADRERALVVANLKVCAVATAIGTPLAAACFVSPSANLFFGLIFLAEIAFFVVSAPINAIILRSVPEHLRASAMALSIFAIHLLGDLWSPPLEGALADVIPMHWAMQLLAVAFGIGALIWWPRSSARATPLREVPSTRD